MNEEEKSLYKDKIIKEAQAAGKLLHPNIVTLFDVFDLKEDLYFNGICRWRTLDEKIRKREIDIRTSISIAIAC